MKKTNLFPMHLNLQLFAEGAGGGDGGTGASGATGEAATAAVSQQNGVKSNPLADVKYGVQPTEETTPAAEVVEDSTEDRNAKYKAFIKEHKDLDDARIQNIVQQRLKNSKETVEKYEALAPTLEILAKKYGVDASDVKALTKAIEEDDTYLEEEAMKKGMTVEQYREFRNMKRELDDLRGQKEEQTRRENANKIYAEWMKQAENVKAVYPSFDLNTEMQNPQFKTLLRSNVDVKTAFEVIHKDEIIPAAMQYTAKAVEQKITNNIIAGKKRPTENGNSSQGAAQTKSDVSQLTKDDRAEIARRVARGERISFG